MLWDGVTHPSWTFGTLLRTIALHGMPHFENIDAGRGAPIVSRKAIRDTSGRSGHTWDTFRAIRRLWKGTLVIKGLLDPRDAELAIDAGADGIIVSTHGGRQIDGVLPALSALPRIVEVAGDTPVMITAASGGGRLIRRSRSGRSSSLSAARSTMPPRSAVKRACNSPSASCATRYTATWAILASTTLARSPATSWSNGGRAR